MPASRPRRHGEPVADPPVVPPAPSVPTEPVPFVPVATSLVTGDSPYRELGNTSREAFKSAMTRSVTKSLPPFMAELDAMYDALAARGMTRLAVPMSWMECKNSTYPTCGVPQRCRNPWSITGSGDAGNVGRWAAYSSYVAAAKAWAERIIAGSPYAGARSIREFIHIYAPASDNNDERAYVQVIVDGVNALPIEGRAPVPAPDKPEYTFGLPEWPSGFERRILDLAPAGRGWDALGDRRAGMAIKVCHHTAGRDNRDSVFDLFNRGGGRWGEACTDAVIDRAGRGYLMLDPWSPDPDEGSGITPWASGPASSLKGIGVPIVQQLGANAVNKRGFSTEHCNVDGQGFTDAQSDLSCKVYGAVITRMHIPWDAFPTNPHLGLRIDAVHDRFAPTSCPGRDWPWGGGYHTAWVQGVIHEAKVLQTGSAPSMPVPVPEPEPLPDPQRYTAFGMTMEQIAHYFGTLRRYNLDGTVDALGFSPEGVLSQLWLQRFGAVGIFPEAEELRAFDSELAPGKEWFATWEGGYTAWLPIDNNRAGWRWLDQKEGE